MTSSSLSPYFYYQGIVELSKTLTGRENIYLGIRPYGFHAGNSLAFVIYPMMLCAELEKTGKKAQFTFYVFINDWEQDGFDLDNTCIKNYPFNVLPKKTTFQYTLNEHKESIVDHWEQEILKGVENISKKYPSITIKSVRNSSMKTSPIMKEVVIKTIQNPDLVGNVLRKSTEITIKDEPYGYCRAICLNCKSAKTNSIYHDEILNTHCPECGTIHSGKYEDFDYWLYHKPLALPRIKECNIDLCITGGDHYKEGDFTSRALLFDAYNIDINLPKTLYTPVLMGRNGFPMGKSKGNYEMIDLESLYKLAYQNNSSQIKIEECGQ